MIKSKTKALKYMEAKQKFNKETTPKQKKVKVLAGIVEESIKDLQKLDDKGKAKYGRVYRTILYPVETLIDTSRNLSTQDTFISDILRDTQLPNLSVFPPVSSGVRRGRPPAPSRTLYI